MTLYVDSNGVASPIFPPFSKMGADGAIILGQEVRGLVSLEAERGLRAMWWPEFRSRQMFPRLQEVKG